MTALGPALVHTMSPTLMSLMGFGPSSVSTRVSPTRHRWSFSLSGLSMNWPSALVS